MVNNNISKLDLVIIGAGPAGLSAAVYAVRSGLSVRIFETNYTPGGQVLTTYEVDNYLGLPGINGFDLGIKFKEHAEKFGIEIEISEITEIQKNENGYIVKTTKEEISAKCVLVSTGAENKKLNVIGEKEFSGKGVSYCATCDGAFFKNKTTAVIGGSYTAVEDAIYLSGLCKKVYVVHRRDKLRAGAYLENKLFACENVEIVWDNTLNEIKGESSVNEIILENTKDKSTSSLNVDGVFIAVGTVPKTQLLKNLIKLDEYGYVKAPESGQTELEGLYVAGDLRKKHLRQITTAVSDGANAATAIFSYLNNM